MHISDDVSPCLYTRFNIKLLQSAKRRSFHFSSAQLDDKNSIQQGAIQSYCLSGWSFQARSPPPPFFISSFRTRRARREYNGKIKINVSSLSEITFFYDGCLLLRAIIELSLALFLSLSAACVLVVRTKRSIKGGRGNRREQTEPANDMHRARHWQNDFSSLVQDTCSEIVGALDPKEDQRK
jgi:hypothetical protein